MRKTIPSETVLYFFTGPAYASLINEALITSIQNLRRFFKPYTSLPSSVYIKLRGFCFLYGLSILPEKASPFLVHYRAYMPNLQTKIFYQYFFAEYM